MKRLSQFFSILSISGILWLPALSFAQALPVKSTKLQVFQINYVGEKYKAFTDGQTGLGLEAYADYGKSWGRLYSKLRGTQSSGSQAFLDGTVSRNCNYNFYQGQFEAGFSLVPIPARDKGVSIFISGGANLGYDWLSLTSSSTALTQLKPSESALSFGYIGGVGMEWVLSKAVGQRNMVSGEINYRVEQANLAGQSSFDLSGFSVHIGFGW